LQVKRDFSRLYQEEADPWGIGQANTHRYNRYRELILAHRGGSRCILDIGCGLGAFLARFENEFAELVGIEVSPEAIARGSVLRPQIRFFRGAAEALEESNAEHSHYDAIVYSDVIYYLNEAGKRASLEWIARHLEPGGVALVAAWCPGGDYLEPGELKALLLSDFRILHEELFESGHAVFVVERKRRLIAITVDYETWQPLPRGKTIEWEIDVFQPADALLGICDEANVRLTFFVEMGEYLYLRRHEPALARRMEEQWREAVSRGHDVQLHLHPSWLPELGARCDNGEWRWDWTRAKAADYPGDLVDLIGKCKAHLERVLRESNPTFKVTSFRAGAYQAQPFRRLYEALAANGIFFDSSVYAGGASEERGYDYSLAYSESAPYFANSFDPQLKAPPSERSIVELPIFTPRRGRRWLLDGDDGERLADSLFAYLKRERQLTLSSEALRRRRILSRALATAYWLGRPVRQLVNRVLPRRLAALLTNYEPERIVGHEYFVGIGHTKGELRLQALADGLRQLRRDGTLEFVTVSELGQLARQELMQSVREDRDAEAAYQVRREYAAVLGESRNESQSHKLQESIPLDRERVLDLGCGAGYWAARIAQRYPWMRVVGVDYGHDFIEQAIDRFASERVAFDCADFAALPFSSERFDCIYADNSLEHAFDVDSTLAEAFRTLSWGGVLVAAIPSDARNPRRICDNHTWKTAPHEVRMRLEYAGFVNVEIRELDSFTQLGMPPYPPSNDKMMYLRAWKRGRAATDLGRALEAMEWVYRRLRPERTPTMSDPIQILTAGSALCSGYALTLGKLLERERYPIKWVTMLARDHPGGRGPGLVDSHAVVVAELDGREVILDPTANTCIPHSLEEVLRAPHLAVDKANPDERYRRRGYELYDTHRFYRLVDRYAVHRTPNPLYRRWRPNRYAQRENLPA
jgi:SAM-dependent methyltransferase